MTVFEICSIIIACFAFIISVIVIWKDANSKMYDLLYKCYDRITAAFDSGPVVSLEKVFEFEENPNLEEAKDFKTYNIYTSYKVERELNIACYYVIKGKIKLKPFFNVFNTWLTERYRISDKITELEFYYREYTWTVVKKCEKKGWFKEPMFTQGDLIMVKMKKNNSLKE